MTPFALIAQACGLSHMEAAGFLDVSLDTVRSWSSGRNRTPKEAIQKLRCLFHQIDMAAEEIVGELGRGHQNNEGTSDLQYSLTSHDMKSLGLPCAGAVRALLGKVVAMAEDDVHFSYSQSI